MPCLSDDAFASEENRQAHLHGSIAAALTAHANEMLASPPSIESIDVVGMKNQLA
jgi:hypothetical protein